MAAAEALELSGVHFGSWAAAEDDFGFFGDAQGFEMMGGAVNQGCLDSVRETALFGSNLEGTDFAGFMPAVALVQSDVRRGKKRSLEHRKGWRVWRRAWVDWL